MEIENYINAISNIYTSEDVVLKLSEYQPVLMKKMLQIKKENIKKLLVSELHRFKDTNQEIYNFLNNLYEII